MYYTQQSNNLLLTRYDSKPVCQCKYMIYMYSNYLLFTSMSSVQEKFESKEQNQCGKVKHELRVQIPELRVQIPELRVQIHKLRVQILDLEDKKHELQD